MVKKPPREHTAPLYFSHISPHIKKADIIIEIRDARLPFTSRSVELQNIIANKIHLLVLNKSDLANTTITRFWKVFFRQQYIHFHFHSCYNKRHYLYILNYLRELASHKMLWYKKRGFASPAIRIMVVGIPNTGKSTFINFLIGAAKARAGNTPGITKHSQWFILGNKLELLDTPGILTPHARNEEELLKLILIKAVKEEQRVKTLASSYLLEKYHHYKLLEEFKERLSLHHKKNDELTDDEKHKFFYAFQKGRLGNITLEKPVDIIL